MPHTWYSSSEVADYLHVRESDVETWARRADIPCVRRGDRYVFRRSEIELWASCRLLDGGGGPLHRFHERSSRALGPAPDPVLAALLTPDRVAPALESRTRASVIRDMVAFAEGTGLLNYPADLRSAIEAREAETTTALPGGVALLHPGHRQPYLVEDSFLLLGRTVQGIPFGAPDGQPTRLFFLLCCGDDRMHLHVLSRLCLVCFHAGAADALLGAGDAEDICAAVRRAETAVLADLAARRWS